MIYIDYNWVSSRWQCSVDLYKSRKQTAPKEKTHTKLYKNAEYTKAKIQSKKKKTNRKRIVMDIASYELCNVPRNSVRV